MKIPWDPLKSSPNCLYDLVPAHCIDDQVLAQIEDDRVTLAQIEDADVVLKTFEKLMVFNKES